MDFASDDKDLPVEHCPFCEGNESETPPEIHADRPQGTAANTPGWRLRVVPNKFPALRIEGDLEKTGEGLYDKAAGLGAHEVFIEGSQHWTTITAVSSDVVRSMLFAYRARMRDLKKDRRLVYGLLFKNVGMRAGASLAHNHSQLIATPVVPVIVQQEIDGARRFLEYRGRCIYCDILRQERSDGKRLVLETREFAAVSAYASRFPFETWILPTRHISHFEDTSDAELEALTDVLLSVLTKLERTLGAPPYNWVIHGAPFNEGPLDHYHWHMEIMPRVTMTAGFEWGSGFYINPVLPEEATRYLVGGNRIEMP